MDVDKARKPKDEADHGKPQSSPSLRPRRHRKRYEECLLRELHWGRFGSHRRSSIAAHGPPEHYRSQWPKYPDDLALIRFLPQTLEVMGKGIKPSQQHWQPQAVPTALAATGSALRKQLMSVFHPLCGHKRERTAILTPAGPLRRISARSGNSQTDPLLARRLGRSCRAVAFASRS